MGGTKVLIGKEDWLFLQNDTNQIVEQNKGSLMLTTAGVTKWVRTLESRFAMLERKKADYYFVIAPNKECIYAEYLPDDYVINDNRVVYQVINAAKAHNLQMLYPIDILKLYKSEHQLYPVGNTHWNGIGAFIAYQYLINVVAKTHHTFKKLDWSDIYFKEEDISEDLGNKLEPPRTSTFIWGCIKEPKAKIVYDNGVVNSGKMQICLNKDTSLPTAVIFHDSFMEMMMPYLMENFSTLYLLHTPTVNYDLIDDVKPDIVISQMVERFFIQPPSDF